MLVDLWNTDLSFWEFANGVGLMSLGIVLIGGAVVLILRAFASEKSLLQQIAGQERLIAKHRAEIAQHQRDADWNREVADWMKELLPIVAYRQVKKYRGREFELTLDNVREYAAEAQHQESLVRILGLLVASEEEELGRIKARLEKLRARRSRRHKATV